MNTNPVGVGVVVSATVKTVLIALTALGWVPITEDAIASVTLAVAAVTDLAVYFGLVKPGVTELVAQAGSSTSGNTPQS